MSGPIIFVLTSASLVDVLVGERKRNPSKKNRRTSWEKRRQRLRKIREGSRRRNRPRKKPKSRNRKRKRKRRRLRKAAMMVALFIGLFLAWSPCISADFIELGRGIRYPIINTINDHVKIAFLELTEEGLAVIGVYEGLGTYEAPTNVFPIDVGDWFDINNKRIKVLGFTESSISFEIE